MSLFGKFMAVLNLFGVIALLIFGLLDYSQRKAWQYANYRHDLFIYGLPLTKADTDLQDYQRYLDLGSPRSRTLTELFPNNPVTTQVQEVERIKQSLDSTLAGVNSNREQHMDLLALTLLPLAQSNRERETLLTIHTVCSNKDALAALKSKMEAAYTKAKADRKKPFDQAFALAMLLPGPDPVFDPKNPNLVPPKGIAVQADREPRRPFEETFVRIIQAAPNTPFDSAFDQTFNTVRDELKQQYDAAFVEPLGTKPGITPDQQRHAIARVLVALDVSLPKDQALETDAFTSPAFMRVVNVIGLEEMNRELNSQAIMLTRISQEQDKEIDRERTAFALWHEALITEAKAMAQSVGQQDDQLRIQKEKIEEQKKLVAQREQNVKDARAELVARRQYTAEMIDIIRQMTDSIHKTRVEVRDANEVNQGLAKKIGELEKKR
jgi:hypothetical protein